MFPILLMSIMPVFFGGTPDASPSNLVVQLGSARYAERESAAKKLLELGPEALDALRDARESKDPEVRTRANALLDKIESSLVIRPTMVRLDFDDQPIQEVVKALADRGGLPLQLANEFHPMWKGVKLTLKDDRPVPFWEALDRLRKAGELGFNTNISIQNGNGPARTGVQLFKANVEGGYPQPICNSGPFRVSFGGADHNRSINFDNQNQAPNQVWPQAAMMPRRVIGGRVVEQGIGNPNAHRSLVTDNFSFRLQVLAEPRLMVAQNGQLKLIEATDDAGNSLMPPGATNGNVVRHAAYYGYNPGNTILQLAGPLTYPEHPGKTIKTLRGSVPVTVSSRKLDPVVITLKDAEGKTFRAGESTVIVHKANKPNPNPGQQGLYIDLTLRTPNAPRQNMGNNNFGFQQNVNPQSQIEILDAQGKAINWYVQSSSGPPSDWRVGICVMPQGGNNNVQPAELRFFELVRGETEATFEFHDIPLP
ncbi:MAG: hypothetical protein NVSMB14_04910 [Isosphaeraceae bacterium]